MSFQLKVRVRAEPTVVTYSDFKVKSALSDSSTDLQWRTRYFHRYIPKLFVMITMLEFRLLTENVVRSRTTSRVAEEQESREKLLLQLSALATTTTEQSLACPRSLVFSLA